MSRMAFFSDPDNGPQDLAPQHACLVRLPMLLLYYFKLDGSLSDFIHSPFQAASDHASCAQIFETLRGHAKPLLKDNFIVLS